MAEHQTSAPLDLTEYKVPEELTTLYDALQEASGEAIVAIMRGESEIQKQWRLASRLCRQYLAVTEEPALLAQASKLGDWAKARESNKPPADRYTYALWLAAHAWRLLQCCRQQEAIQLIDPVRHSARDGIIAVKTMPSLQRVLAQREVNGESQVDDRERGPQLAPAGRARSTHLTVV